MFLNSYNITRNVNNMQPYLEILMEWLKDSIFIRQHKMVQELLLSLIKDAIQYNNPLRAPWKRCAKFEPKSKRGSKEL